jgi:hypothetical protein
VAIQLQATYTKVTLIQVYTPTNAANDEDRDEVCELLQQVLDVTPEHNMKIVMGTSVHKLIWTTLVGRWQKDSKDLARDTTTMYVC